MRIGTYREVQAAELVDERFHPGFILFVDWSVNLETFQKNLLPGDISVTFLTKDRKMAKINNVTR